MSNITTIDASGRRERLKEFFVGDGAKIWFFHDSLDILPRLAAAGCMDEKTVVYASSSWYVGDYRAGACLKTMRQCQGHIGDHFDVTRNIVFLANSKAELAHLQARLPPQSEVLLVNNTCFLDTQLFSILPDAGKKWNCIVNAKPMAFKRLHLAALVPDKALITYDTHEPDRGNATRTPPGQIGFAAIFNNLPENQVVAKLNEGRLGLMLSEEEGACYANTEYLLCGLPVVSTPSRGGRDEFYDSITAVICEPDQRAVLEAVDQALARLKSGEITPAAIRTRTLDRIAVYRSTLANSLREKQQRFGPNVDLASHLHTSLVGNNKMKAQRNFFAVNFELE
jgi:hypothetical protein